MDIVSFKIAWVKHKILYDMTAIYKFTTIIIPVPKTDNNIKSSIVITLYSYPPT